MKLPGFLNTFKYILTFLALVNLILLFGFHYEIPASIMNKLTGENPQDELYLPEDERTEKEKPGPVNLTFENDTISYDGSEEIDLLSGVSVTDKFGRPLELTVYSLIKNTDEPSKKTILYTVCDEEGNEASADRNLVLDNYSGPSLSIGQPYPQIFDVELNHILETFKEADLLNANDGYGKNITDSIQCKYKIGNAGASEIKITFTITKHFEDTETKSITIPLSRTKPLIVLKQTSIKLKKSEAFDPMEYVESATNEEGRDLTSRINVKSNVNTSATGNYEVTYTLTDSDREQADPMVLKVTVEE